MLWLVETTGYVLFCWWWCDYLALVGEWRPHDVVALVAGDPMEVSPVV